MSKLILFSKRKNQLEFRKHKFCPRVVSNTNIVFTNEEIMLLNRGLQYNLHFKNKDWLKKLALEADTAISIAEPKDQDFLRHTIANKLKVIAHNSHMSFHHRARFIVEKEIMVNLREKLLYSKACILKADKGKTIVIVNIKDYNDKISKFVSDTDYVKLDLDPTSSYQKQANQAIHNCLAIKNIDKWKLKSLNPAPPIIKGLIKLHKELNPIRPVINMCSSPSYKLGKFVSNHLSNLLCLPYSFNVKNSS
jgi:hypothetical protein